MSVFCLLRVHFRFENIYLKSVSYTHLDVYKRQVCTGLCTQALVRSRVFSVCDSMKRECVISISVFCLCLLNKLIEQEQ